MSLFVVISCLALISSVFALPQERAVTNPKTPNQILQAVVEGAAAKIKSLGWDVSKNVRDGYSDVPLFVKEHPDTSERFAITNAEITGLGSLRRSIRANFTNSEHTKLKAMVKFEDLRAIADYELSFGGVGYAAPDVTRGKVTDLVRTIFIDMEISLKNLVPQNIMSYNVRIGNEGLEEITNMSYSAMKNINVAGIRKALRQLVINTVNTNIKVQINKAIQDMKTAA